MITSELVLGDGPYFVERIPLFLEFQQILGTPALAGPSLHVRSNVTPPVFEDFLTVLTGDVPCIMADDSNGLKLLALEFKCDRLLTKFNISPDGDYTFTQHKNVNEWLTHVSDLPLTEIDESLKSYVTALPDGSGLSRACSL